ncbi:MAG: (2Fe-2S) ferredoxin domain-containing protein [Armatimonadetes bacterium]|nr:(2Fe-2S) ferredoxin domain-containing protein [Armatimonadota bacterium]
MNLDDLRRLREKAARELALRSEHRRFRVVVCMGTSGLAKGSREVMDALLAEVDRLELDDVEVVATGSSGVEDLEPIVTVEEGGETPVVYGQLDADAARRIITEHVVKGRKVTQYVIARRLPGEVS